MAISQFIEQDLQQRLAAGEHVSLRMRALAKHYNSSLSPVNAAIRSLVDKKVLKRLDNGRVELFQTPTITAQEALPETAQEQHKRVREQLIEWSLRGEDIDLREEAMETHFGIGRTALRRLFSEIAATKIITHVPRKGWRLQGFTEAALGDYIVVRAQLEPLAVDLAKGRLCKQRLSEFLANNQGNRRIPDNRFHQYIIDTADNHYISSFFATHAPFFQVVFSWEDNIVAGRKQTLAQHRAVLEPMLEDRWDEAKAALRHHVQYNHDYLRSQLRLYQEREINIQ